MKYVNMTDALRQVREKAPDTADAMKRHKAGNAGFTDKAHLKAKGLIPRADGTKKVSPKYEETCPKCEGEECQCPSLEEQKDNTVQEKMQKGFVVRFFDPANKKRFAMAWKTKKDADDKAAQLKRDGLKDISITTHTLNFSNQINFRGLDKPLSLHDEVEIKEDKETDLEEACWVGYKKVGMKKKGDKMVPNCVKEEVVDDLFGKDYIYESIADMYKGSFSKDQLAKMKKTWSTKKASDVTPSVKNFVKGLDQFTQMDIKGADIKYISDLIEDLKINEENELMDTLTNIIENQNYFSKDQLNRLAKAYGVMKDRTISVSNAKKLSDMIGRLPDHALNDVRKKKIPFISGLALSKMIQRKIPVTETYTVQITKKDGSKMTLGRYNTSHEAQRYVDQYGSGAKVVKEDLNSDDKKTIEPIIKQLQKSVKSHDKQAKQLKKDIADEKDLEEADLSKSQITKVHKQADDLPKKDFIKRYGKDGDAVRYATATNMVKKKLGLGEDHKLIKKGELKMNESYKLKLNSAMEHYKIASLGELKDEDQKEFFNYVDSLSEGLTAGQKKLPAGLQKAILAKQGKKDDSKDEMHDMKKDDKKDIKEEDAYDGTPAEVAKMKAKEKADAEKAKAKSKNEDLVGGQKKLDKDKDGDLDAKDFAMLRKTKSEAVKTGEADAEPKVKELNAMVKASHKPDHKGNPIDDMNAMYMKSNVKAAVKDNGGADMAVVKDTPEMMNAMMKISKEKKMVNMKAMYGESRENAKRYLDTKPGSIEEAVLVSRGLVKKSITEARYEIEGKVNYRGIGSEDAFHMVINANSEKDAEDKADDELRKARNKRKIGPGGGGNIDEVEIESVERTNDKLSAPETFRPGN